MDWKAVSSHTLYLRAMPQKLSCSWQVASVFESQRKEKEHGQPVSGVQETGFYSVISPQTDEHDPIWNPEESTCF